jgi:hypothetical protein
MNTFHGRTSRHPLRGLAAGILTSAGLALTACGGSASTPTAAQTASPSATPLPPAGAQFTETGDVKLVTNVDATGVTCSFPTISGPQILVQVATSDGKEGGYITLNASTVFVRVGAGAGGSYTERDFSGPGVSNFDAAKGATFNAQLHETTPAGQNAGTIGTVSSVSGSVSCGTKTPGSGTITISGNGTGGSISGALTSILVKCPAGKTFAIINGLTTVGSAPANVEIGGADGSYFASISTSSMNYFFGSSGKGLYTVGNGHVTWTNAVLAQTNPKGAGSITISGDATCGS